MRKLFLILFLFSFAVSEGQPMRKLLSKRSSGTPGFSDTFTGTDGTSLTASGWNLADGFACGTAVDWTIQSNRAVTNAGLYTIAWKEASMSDGVASLDLVIPNSNNYIGGILFRYSSCANYWVVVIERDASGTPYMAIYKVASGTLTSEASVNVPAATNSTVNVQVTLSGNSIVALASTGETCNTSNSFNATATKFGLWGYLDGAYASVPADNISVN